MTEHSTRDISVLCMLCDSILKSGKEWKDLIKMSKNQIKTFHNDTTDLLYKINKLEGALNNSNGEIRKCFISISKNDLLNDEDLAFCCWHSLMYNKEEDIENE